MNSPVGAQYWSVGAQYATGEEWRNNSRKNEETEPKQKQCPAVDVTGDGSKEQYCLGTWNVRSRNVRSSYIVLSFGLFILFMAFSRQEY